MDLGRVVTGRIPINRGRFISTRAAIYLPTYLGIFLRRLGSRDLADMCECERLKGFKA